MNDHVAKPIDKERRCFACSVIRQERRVGAPATAADAGELVEARATSSGVSAAAWS